MLDSNVSMAMDTKTVIDLCFPDRPSSTNNSHAVQSSSDPACHNMVSKLDHHSLKFVILICNMNSLFRSLSDIDQDGKLTAEEFILAMHLIDMAMSGVPLPPVLPPEYLPPTFR